MFFSDKVFSFPLFPQPLAGVTMHATTYLTMTCQDLRTTLINLLDMMTGHLFQSMEIARNAKVSGENNMS